jgi:hypothetical protein
VAALALQGQHSLGQLLVINNLPVPPMADIEILTKIAQQVAVGEKYGSGTVLPDQGRFFTKVRVKTGNPRFIKRLAHTCLLSAVPVDITTARAQAAVVQSTFGLHCPTFELA